MRRGAASSYRTSMRVVRLCCVAAVTLAAGVVAVPQGKSPRRRAPPRVKSPVTAAAATPAPALRAHYQLQLSLDFDARSYTGQERVRWVNQDDRPTSIIYFHLYPNKRVPAAAPETGPASDDPRLTVSAVRSGTGGPLPFTLDEHETVLRVNLRESIAPGEAAEVEIGFAGSVPEIEADEASLLAHVMQQINSVFRSEREMRQSRDVNFSCRGVMLLGTPFPMLAVRSGDDWRRKTDVSVGDFVFAETADYEVTVELPTDVHLFASAENTRSTPARTQPGRTVHHFAGGGLRDFALIAGRSLRAEERMVGGLRVRSIYLAGHEAPGRRVLAKAAEAARVYATRFGPSPYKVINLAEVPLVARLGSVEFTGLGCLASAFYVDFDGPAMRNLPEIVREQRASIEDSLEFTVAHVVAQQWWGSAVGSDPERAPVLDEALSNWSALLYYRDVYGEERAAAALDDQLRGVYKIYRTFGGEDMTADRATRDYRNSFQYSAIVVSKGALMFVALRRLLGDERFFAALKSYYNANLFELAEMDDLRGAFVAETPLAERRAVIRTFNRWLSEKRGDEDIAPPDPQLAAALGITIDPARVAQKGGDSGNAFARLGKFFWRQMTRIR